MESWSWPALSVASPGALYFSFHNQVNYLPQVFFFFSDQYDHRKKREGKGRNFPPKPTPNLLAILSYRLLWCLIKSHVLSTQHLPRLPYGRYSSVSPFSLSIQGAFILVFYRPCPQFCLGTALPSIWRFKFRGRRGTLPWNSRCKW